ncbi:hypothetical protein DFJ74DRAFT_195097 [Hyaloraphidium curvatum]|nr:hypothetical protein DFJ74DRAFT_195097 [Hyaloraphidium curvatum]
MQLCSYEFASDPLGITKHGLPRSLLRKSAPSGTSFRRDELTAVKGGDGLPPQPAPGEGWACGPARARRRSPPLRTTLGSKRTNAPEHSDARSRRETCRQDQIEHPAVLDVHQQQNDYSLGEGGAAPRDRPRGRSQGPVTYGGARVAACHGPRGCIAVDRLSCGRGCVQGRVGSRGAQLLSAAGALQDRGWHAAHGAPRDAHAGRGGGAASGGETGGHIAGRPLAGAGGAELAGGVGAGDARVGAGPVGGVGVAAVELTAGAGAVVGDAGDGVHGAAGVAVLAVRRRRCVGTLALARRRASRQRIPTKIRRHRIRHMPGGR